MIRVLVMVAAACWLQCCFSRDEDKISKACYWPNEMYEPCFGGCAEVSCDNPRNHLRPCYPYCEPGCICEDPYVRDDRTHQCVLPQDCSPTQMGIPVPTRRGSGKLSLAKFEKPQRSHKRSDALPPPLVDIPNETEDLPPPPNNLRSETLRSDTLRSDALRSDTLRSDALRSDALRSDALRSDTLRSDTLRSDTLRSDNSDFKRPSEISRMGNYFNIVIAPPPIKALQPRKLLQQNDGFRSDPKRM